MTSNTLALLRPGEPQSMLGVGYEVTQAANGPPGLRFGGPACWCARGECDRAFWWDGTQFRDRPRPRTDLSAG